MDGKGLFILCEAVIMVTLAIAYGIWCATSDKSDKSEKSEKRELKVYTYYKKDFDNMWETINSWCVKYCNKEFPRYHDEIFLDKSEISYESYPYELEKINWSYRLYVGACKFPKLWESVIVILNVSELSVIDKLYVMEFLTSFNTWRVPKDSDVKYCLNWTKCGILETREDIMGTSQYKIKEKYLGD